MLVRHAGSELPEGLICRKVKAHLNGGEHAIDVYKQPSSGASFSAVHGPVDAVQA